MTPRRSRSPRDTFARFLGNPRGLRSPRGRVLRSIDAAGLGCRHLHGASFVRRSRLHRCDEEVRDLLGATRSVDSDLGQRSAGCCGLRAHVRQRRRDQKARSRLGRLARRSVHRRPGSCGTTGCVAERGRPGSINPRRIRIDLHPVASMSISGIAPLASADTFRDVWGLVWCASRRPCDHSGGERGKRDRGAAALGRVG